MAAPRQDPLEILDKMFNEVLVQTGKHLRANSKEGPRNASANNAIRAKTSDSVAMYHYALDDLESEITRAKAVILRDLEKLRTARAPVPVPVPAPAPVPVPVPAPVPAPAPAPAPQPVAPPAPMMELPSSAAHSMSTPAFTPKQESKPAAPFPDMGMGMGMSTDVVDLTSKDKKPSPRVPPGTIRQPVRATPPIKNEVKPSPKQLPKPSPKLAQPPKVTPVPLPQIPRLQPPQPPAIGPAATAQSQPAAPNSQSNRQVQATPAAQAAQDATLDATPVPVNAAGSGTNTAGKGSTLGFTDMQFSLAPPSNEASGAPPAPMPEFDLTSFTTQGVSNDASLDPSKANGADVGAVAGAGQNNTTVPQQQPGEDDKISTSFDDLFNLDNTNGGMGSMFDLGGGGGNDSTFNDVFYEDTDLVQLDEDFNFN
ncbi:hypothetical protein F5Y11DRAFT_347456 [Daldinia sp. FL1419]|nr:hypothetical protein F5Y11DRAFT_347456 [Daldinia sp. FL1419]